MPTYEENRADPFSITVLVASVLIVVFLIISSIYFSNLIKLRPPSKAESTFLFWTSLLLTIIATVIAILAIVHIFTHKHVTNIIENKIVAPPAKTGPTKATPPPRGPSAAPPPITQTRTRSPARTGSDDGFKRSFADMSQYDRSATDKNLRSLSDWED